MQPAADPEVALALARASIAEARLLEPEVLLAVLEASRLAYRNLDDIDERLAIVEEMCSLADRLEHRAHALEGRFSLLHIHFERGDRRAANERADEYRALVRAFPMPVHVGNAALVDSTFASIDGKFAEADAICATVPTGPTVSAFVPAVPHRGAISRAWGSPEALERSFASVSAAREPIRSAILAALHDSMGNREGARAALESVVMHIGPDGLSERTPYIGRLVLADAAVFLEDVPRARILYELLLPMAERHAVWVPSCVYEGSIQHRVGQLASVLGRSDEAVARLEAAIVANASMGSRPWVARAEDACASALRKRGRPADVARAETLERSALATYESLGMTTHAEALRKRMAGAPPEPARDEPAVSSRGLEPKLVMEQTGDRWTISYGDDAAQLKDADGLHYLAALVARPEVDVHVLDLLAVRGRTGVETGDAGPALDARAKAAYKERLEDLADRLEEAERFGDTGKAERAEAEMAAIKDELARAVGLGGRDRKTGASAERARVNVTLRIKKAVEKIDAVSPGLGHHLKTCVKTGVFCIYRPPPRAK
jgi:tetratricopeptide (TPR) repeat protein